MERSSSHALGLTHKLRAERYKKELEGIERKNENLSWANSHISRKLLEANQRGQRLAVNLGFRDIFEAETVVSRNPGDFNYFSSEQMLRSRRLERELVEQQEMNSSRPQQDQQEMPETLPDDLPTDTTSLRHELIDLRHRYDSLMEAKEKAAAIYKKDYKKWRDYKRQVYEEAIRDQKKKRYRSVRSLPKGKGCGSPNKNLGGENIKPILGIDAHGDHKTKQLSRCHSRASNETDKENHILTSTIAYCNMHPPSPYIFSTTAQVFSYRSPALHRLAPSPTQSTSVRPTSEPSRDVLLGDPNRWEPPSMASHTTGGSSSKLKKKRSEPSSETEDDSQAPETFVTLKPPVLSLHSEDRPPQPGAAAPSSEIQDDLQAHKLINPFKKPALPMRPKAQVPILKQFAAPASFNNNIPAHDLSARLTKSRRTDTRNDEEASTSRRRLDPWNGSRNSKQDVVGKECGHGLTDIYVGGTTKLDGIDYSEYKGRGRYARTAQQDGNITINAQYEIDANHNNGLDFQYDAVVRNGRERKHLDGGDCECCRDYYEAIGPLPPRLQQPLWRSPTSSPDTSRARQSRGTRRVIQPSGLGDASLSSKSTDRRDNDIAQHKKDISRHRHNWERASTPPGYWNIGFPSTQEASDINEQAKEMHRQKFFIVEQEANKMDGRYKKR